MYFFNFIYIHNTIFNFNNFFQTLDKGTVGEGMGGIFETQQDKKFLAAHDIRINSKHDFGVL